MDTRLFEVLFSERGVVVYMFLTLFNNPGFTGFMGVILGAVVSGYASYCVQKNSSEVLIKNLEKELNHQSNLDKYKIMVEVYKNAIEAAVDIMHATWIKNDNPTDTKVESVFLEAWGRTWKSSGYLRIFLSQEEADKYDLIVGKMQTIKIDDLKANPNSIDDYYKRIKGLREEVYKILQPLKKLIDSNSK